MSSSRGAAASARVLVALLGLSLGVACEGVPPAASDAAAKRAAGARPEQLLLVTVAGLRAEHVLPNNAGGPLPLPGLARLARAGVFAAGVRSVGPPLAYPAHAIYVTGNAPDRHGVVADRLLGKRGVRNAPFWHATRVHGASLWQQLRAQGRSVAAIGWPSTVGASIDLLVPDLLPVRSGETWLGVLEGAAAPPLLAAMRAELPSPRSAWPAAIDRDRAHVAAACAAMRPPRAPALVLVRLVELGSVVEAHGGDADEVGPALARVDALIERLAGCQPQVSSALVIVGGTELGAVHTRIDPNVALAEAGLLFRGAGQQVASWTALVRATDSLATVHATTEAAALAARRLLDGLAHRSGAFRVVSAGELEARRGDPEAWFGLEARPGYVFGDGALPPLLRAAERRAAGVPGTARAFLASGRGVRNGVRVPAMTQLDVAPTLAELLGVSLEGAEGRVLVGILSVDPRVVGQATPGLANAGPGSGEAQ